MLKLEALARVDCEHLHALFGLRPRLNEGNLSVEVGECLETGCNLNESLYVLDHFQRIFFCLLGVLRCKTEATDVREVDQKSLFVWESALIALNDFQ